MNYKKIYDDLISSRQLLNRRKECGFYYERHHIVPKCFGGSNDNENVVLLTAREHFVTHLLLVEMHEGRNRAKMACALWKMTGGNKHQDKSHFNSRKFELVRKILSESMKGKNSPMHKPGAREKASKSKKGVKFSEKRLSKNKILRQNNKASYKWTKASREKMSNSVKGKPKSESHKKSLSLVNIGKKLKPETIEKRQKTRIEKASSQKPIIQLSLEGEFIKEWPSLVEAKKLYGNQIGHCLIGNAKTAYGFKWVYKYTITT